DERIAAGSAPEYRPCPPHVAPHRVEELVDGGELLHVADVVHEVDGGPTAVQIRGLVQDERLDATGTVPEGRVGPHGDRRGVPLAGGHGPVHGVVVEEGEPPGVHAVGRHGRVLGKVEVRGGVPELPAPATGAVDHLSG